MIVNNIDKAWEMVKEMFPTNYQKDKNKSEKAGYDVCTSTDEDHYYDYICDLGDRLEANLSTGETTNIWIVEDLTESINAADGVTPDTNEEAYIEVIVTARKTGEEKHFADFNEFIKEWRFIIAAAKCVIMLTGMKLNSIKCAIFLLKKMTMETA